MADLSDVLTALGQTIGGILYPNNGTASPSAVTAPCKIFPGWPNPAQLDADLAAGTVNVSIYPGQVEQNTTRYQLDWQPLPVPAATLTATIGANSITIGGTVSVPQNVSAIVNGNAYSYAVASTDTLASIASSLAALINADTPASTSGATISIPAAHAIIARIGVTGTAIKEIGRQNKQFQITCWCPTWQLRDAIGKVLGPALRAIEFLTLADGTAARFLYQRTMLLDSFEKAGLYRRDIFYMIEWGETLSMSGATVTIEQTNLSGGLNTTGIVVSNGPALVTINE